MKRVVGIVLLVVGIALFATGMNASESLADQTSNFFTGEFTDSTMWYLIVGVASAIGGLTLVTVGGRGN